MEIFFENKVVVMSYNPTNKRLYFNWRGTVDPDLIVEGLKVSMKFAEKRPCETFITDLTQMKGTFTKVNGFITKEFTPVMEKHGVTHCATIMSSDPFTRFAINQAIKFLSGKLVTKVFKTAKEGNEWLDEKTSRQ